MAPYENELLDAEESQDTYEDQEGSRSMDAIDEINSYDPDAIATDETGRLLQEAGYSEIQSAGSQVSEHVDSVEGEGEESETLDPLNSNSELDANLINKTGAANSFSESTELDDEEISTQLKSLVNTFDNRDEYSRELILRDLKKYDLYWNDIQFLFFDYAARWWANPTIRAQFDPEFEDEDYSAKSINIIKPYGESIIAALSTELPGVVFPPEDADVEEDLTASKAADKISELIDRDNDAQVMFAYAIFILWLQHFVAAHIYEDKDEKYGVTTEPIFETKETQYQNIICETCSEEIGMLGANMPMPQMANCPTCGGPQPTMLGPVYNQSEQVQTGEKTEPKSKVCIKFYGPKNVKISPYATCPEELPYVDLQEDIHYALAAEIYKDYSIRSGATYNEYERYARASILEEIDPYKDIVTRRRVWFRPWAFNVLGEETAVALKSKYSEGCCVHLVGTEVKKVEPAILDNDWKFTKSPLSSHLYAQPGCKAAMQIQDIRNDAVNITLQTMEYGIPQTFADSGAIDFDKYRQRPARPGEIYPAKRPGGARMDDAFATIKTASLATEVPTVIERADQDGQFVTGAMPAIWGGMQSDTASQDAMSRTQALQRLQIQWKMLCSWWVEVKEVAVQKYIKCMREDVKYTKQSGGKNFITITVLRASLSGKIAKAQGESNQGFPISWAQKRDALMNLMRSGNEIINSVIVHPENANLIARTLGFNELYIPGDDDRTKQLYEINELMNSAPIPDVTTGQIMPSVPVDPYLDNHEAEFQTCIAWLKSPIGLEMKKINQGGWSNVKLHAMYHWMAMAPEVDQSQQKGEPGKSQPKDKNIIEN